MKAICAILLLCPSLFAAGDAPKARKQYGRRDLQIAGDAALRKERKQYGAHRLQQLQQQDDTKPLYQSIGTFTETNMYTHDTTTILLVTKVKKMCNSSCKLCKRNPPCKPMMWRQNENGRIVQYEIHQCSCDKARERSAAKARRHLRHVELQRREKRRLASLRRENEIWAVTRRKRLREVVLQNQIERMRYGNMRSLQQRQGHDRYGTHGYRYQYGY